MKKILILVFCVFATSVFAQTEVPTYYNPAKYKSYLDQLGIVYPTIRPDQKEAVEKLPKK